MSEIIKSVIESIPDDYELTAQHKWGVGGFYSVCRVVDLKTIIAERDRLRASLQLYACVECGHPSFEISPTDPSTGFCWNCRRLLIVTAPKNADAEAAERYEARTDKA